MTMPDSDPNTIAPAPQASRIKPFSNVTREALAHYRDANGLSLGDLARELDSNPTQISKYLSGKPEGDVQSLENNAEDVMKKAALRRNVQETLFETPASRRLHAACELIRKTNDVGLVHGPAGLGKTCGVKLYEQANPLVLVVTLSKWCASATGLETALFSAMESRSKRADERRCDWMVRRLKDSNRLILIDNAHRLTSGGLAWLFDLHDATRCPIALVGNPEVLAAIRKNDQQFSRIGLVRAAKNDGAEAVAKQMLALHCPESAAELLDLAMKVVTERGHLRALKKHLLLVPELIGPTKGDVRRAFLMAHTQLVADYTLEN